MVKLRAPMMSLGASGSLGKAITFSRWKGRAYARELVVPSNPKSGLQTGFRAMFAFLSQQWTNVATSDQATWATLADQLVASNFNAYMQFNQKRWRNFTGPTQNPANLGGGDAATYTSSFAATAGVDSILIDWDINSPEDGWGVAIFRALAPAFTPSLSNCIKVVQCDTAGADTWLDSPLVPDTYYYNMRAFSKEGLLHAAIAEINAVVT